MILVASAARRGENQAPGTAEGGVTRAEPAHRIRHRLPDGRRGIGRRLLHRRRRGAARLLAGRRRRRARPGRPGRRRRDAGAVPRGHRAGRPGSSAAGSGRRTTRRPPARCTSGSRRRSHSGSRPRAGSSRRRRSARSGSGCARSGATGVPFYDYTFSAPKSVSVLWASLLQAAAEAEAERREADAKRYAERAEQIRAAVKRAERPHDQAGRAAARVRAHRAPLGDVGRVARRGRVHRRRRFPQHTNRDGDPQLHVHNAIANRAQRADGADEQWRALHGTPLFRDELGVGAYGERFLEQELELARLAAHGAPRGRRRRSRSAASARRPPTRSPTGARRLRDRVPRARGGVRARARPRSGQASAGGRSSSGPRWRRATPRSTTRRRRSSELAAWARKAERSGIGQLAALHEAADRVRGGARAERAAERGGAGPRISAWPSPRCSGRTPCGAGRSWFSSSAGSLPSLPADVDPEEYLDELAEEAAVGPGRGRERAAGRAGAGRHRRDRGWRCGRTARRSTGRRARRCSAPPSTGTMSSTWSTSRCCRCRSGSAPRRRPRPWRARTWTTRSGRHASAC